jgi:hypothetical protein
MTARIPIHRGLALALGLSALLLLAPAAQADQAYDQVSAAFSRAGGNLDPCAFTTAQLKAALRGVPPAFRNTIPDFLKAVHQGIAAHAHGKCKGRRPTEEGTTGGAAAGTAPPGKTAPPVTTTPAQAAPVAPTGTVPATTAPAPATTTPAPATAPAQPAAGAAHRRDRTPLLVALIAVGALVLLALLLWMLARMRGWDPTWSARVRHGWGEAGFRATSTWSEFTDWLRLGR